MVWATGWIIWKCFVQVGFSEDTDIKPLVCKKSGELECGVNFC